MQACKSAYAIVALKSSAHDLLHQAACGSERAASPGAALLLGLYPFDPFDSTTKLANEHPSSFDNLVRAFGRGQWSG